MVNGLNPNGDSAVPVYAEERSYAGQGAKEPHAENSITQPSARSRDAALGQVEPAPVFEDEHVADLARTMHKRVTRNLERTGRLARESDLGEDSAPEPDLLAPISAASVQGRATLATESKPARRAPRPAP